MKRALRIAAIVVAMAGVGTWLVLGLNMGWTKTSITVMQIDPVTDIRYPTYHAGFSPGVDFLAACIVTSLGLFGASLAMRGGRPLSH